MHLCPDEASCNLLTLAAYAIHQSGVVRCINHAFCGRHCVGWRSCSILLSPARCAWSYRYWLQHMTFDFVQNMRPSSSDMPSMVTGAIFFPRDAQMGLCKDFVPVRLT